MRWVKSWLSGRRQRVVIDGVASGWELVLSGVPQGSVLGPVLFIVFIDDIDEGIRSTVLKFADDTKLVARVGSEEDRERLRQDLVELYKWSEDWQMLFNLDKCSVMHFGFAKTAFTLDKHAREHAREHDARVHARVHAREHARKHACVHTDAAAKNIVEKT